jgi:endonuclease YncB( thermonuclease family)
VTLKTAQFILAAVLAAEPVFCADARAQSRPELLRMIGQTLSGTIISVADGDTVRARLDGGRTLTLRLEGIDTPEQGEPFSTQARNATRVLLFNKKVQLRATDVDRYDRLVARIVLDGRDSSIELVKAGLACHFTRFVNDPLLAEAQLSARTAGRGFWAAGAAKPACVKFTGVAP